MKTKLLFLIGSYETGGKERQLTEIIKNLSMEKYELYLFMKECAGRYFGEIRNRLTGFLNLNRRSFSFSSFMALDKYQCEVNPNVVVSFATATSHMALVSKVLRRSRFRLFNMSIRDAPATPDFSQRLESCLYNLYETVVANSQAGLVAYRQAGKKGRTVLYNGFDFQRLPAVKKNDAKKAVGFDKQLFNVVMIASLRECYSKDPLTFLRTAQSVQDKDTSIRFYLIGDGEKRTELEQYARENCIHNLTFMGLRSDVEMILCAADVSVLTSKTEGISNSILESMACGVPVIATSGGGTPEIIDNGKNGLILPFGDYKAIAQKIIELKNNPELLKQLSKHAKQTVNEKFSISTMIHNFETIIGSP